MMCVENLYWMRILTKDCKARELWFIKFFPFRKENVTLINSCHRIDSQVLSFKNIKLKTQSNLLHVIMGESLHIFWLSPYWKHWSSLIIYEYCEFHFRNRFKCIDLDGNGVLTRNEMQFFYEEQLHRMECMAQEPVLFEDILCQIIDMIKPEVHISSLFFGTLWPSLMLIMFGLQYVTEKIVWQALVYILDLDLVDSVQCLDVSWVR